MQYDAADHLKQNISDQNKPEFAANLLWLETICRNIGITDLHCENVLLTPEGKWVPIDLEVIKFGHVTGLYGNKKPNLMDLSEPAKVLIQQFNSEQPLRLARSVPVATVVLSEAGTEFDGAIKLAEKIRNVLENEFELLVSSEQLE